MLLQLENSEIIVSVVISDPQSSVHRPLSTDSLYVFTPVSVWRDLTGNQLVAETLQLAV